MPECVVASFVINGKGLGHASRLIAIHDELRTSGVLGSALFVEHRMELIRDYSFKQVVIPSYPGRLMRNAVPDEWRRAERLARTIVEHELEGTAPVVLHDVTVHRTLYDAAVAHAWPQALLVRPSGSGQDRLAWVKEHAPGITTILEAGRPNHEADHEGIRVLGVDHVVRRPLGDRPLWDDQLEDHFRIAVVAGGGGRDDSRDYIATAVAGVDLFSRRCGRPVDLQVVTGPFFTGHVRIPGGCPAAVTVHRYVPPSHSPYADASVVVAQSGYNTFHELARAGVRHVLVPGHTGSDDQAARSRTRADATGVRVTGSSAEHIERAIAAVLAEPPPAAQRDIGHTGAWQVAALLEILSGV